MDRQLQDQSMILLFILWEVQKMNTDNLAGIDKIGSSHPLPEVIPEAPLIGSQSRDPRQAREFQL